MPIRAQVIAAACAGLVFLFSAAAASAQMAGFRDLTLGSRVPTEHLSIPETCEKPDSTIDESPGQEAPNDATGGPAKVLELTILAVSPAKLEIGNDFDASVRLKNIGAKPVLVPAAADGERMLSTSADGTEEKYEVGDVSFRLLAGKEHKIPVYLNSAGALFADPDDRSSYLSLGPGSWLEMKLHARVECGLEDCVAEIQPDNKAVLSAWWYQRILTHRVQGCRESHGSVKVRELDSPPFSVVVRNPSAKTKPTKSNLAVFAWH
jgi:hypothetical protein